MTIARTSRQHLSRAGAVPIEIWSGTGIACIVAGSAWIAKDLGGRLSSADYMACASTYGRVMNGVDTIAFLAMVPALLGLFAAYRRGGGRWLGVTAPIAAVGFAMAGVTNALEHCRNGGPITFPFELFPGFAESSPYVLGLVLGWFLVPFTLTLTRARWLPRWSAWLLVVGTIAFWPANNQGGMVIFGATWVVLGFYLVTHRTSTTHDAGPT